MVKLELMWNDKKGFSLTFSRVTSYTTAFDLFSLIKPEILKISLETGKQSEFNKFEPRLKSSHKLVSIEHQLKS